MLDSIKNNIIIIIIVSFEFILKLYNIYHCKNVLKHDHKNIRIIIN